MLGHSRLSFSILAALTSATTVMVGWLGSRFLTSLASASTAIQTSSPSNPFSISLPSAQKSRAGWSL